MTRLVVVPNVVSDAINKKLDDAYLATPDAAIDRELHFQIMLNYFDENGILPEFELKRNLKEGEKTA